MATSAAVGDPLGYDQSGFRVVKVRHNAGVGAFATVIQ